MTEAESSLLAVMQPKPKTFLPDEIILRWWRDGFNTFEIAEAANRPESEIANRLARLRDAAVAG